MFEAQTCTNIEVSQRQLELGECSCVAFVNIGFRRRNVSLLILVHTFGVGICQFRAHTQFAYAQRMTKYELSCNHSVVLSH